MANLLIELAVLAVAIILLYILFKILKEVIVLLANSIAGIIILFLLNIIFGLGIPINIFTLGIVALAGVVGLIVILVLHFLGIAF
jgi:hypothetical protein